MKKWYQSRTLWINILGAIAYFVQAQTGFVVPEQIQVELLAAINIALRLDTDTGISL